MNFEARFSIGQKVFAVSLSYGAGYRVGPRGIVVVWDEVKRVSFGRGDRVEYMVGENTFVDERDVTANSDNVGDIIIDVMEFEEKRIEAEKIANGEKK